MNEMIESSTQNMDEISELDFLSMVEEATANNIDLIFDGKMVRVSKALKLKRSDALVICGGTIIGECHSIFAIGTCRNHGPPALTLKGVKLIHTMQSADRREIGAAVFVMGKAHVLIVDSFIYSLAGFGLW